MTNFLGNFLLEIGLFSLLGVLYYFYQKKKIIHYEENKIPIVMDMILQACLVDKNTEETNQPLDAVIEALDDFLNQKIPERPIRELKQYAQTSNCTPELKNVIDEGLLEIGPYHGKK